MLLDYSERPQLAHETRQFHIKPLASSDPPAASRWDDSAVSDTANRGWSQGRRTGAEGERLGLCSVLSGRTSALQLSSDRDEGERAEHTAGRASEADPRPVLPAEERLGDVRNSNDDQNDSEKAGEGCKHPELA